MGDRQKQEATSRPSLLSSAVQTYGTNLAVAVLSLVNVLVVARTLGPAGRGDVAFLTAIAWFTSHLSTFGVQEANVNLAGSEPALRRSLATNSLLLAAIFGAATAAFLTLLVAVFPAVGGESDAGLRELTFAALPVIILGVYMRFLIQGDYGFRVTNAAWLITPVANVAVNGILALVGVLSVSTAVVTWIAGQTLGTAVLLWYVVRRSAGFGRPDARLARRTLGFGLRSHVGRVMLVGNYRLDQWILGAIAGSKELGLYSVAVAWAEALWYLPTALSAVQRPDLVRVAREEAVRQASRLFRASVLITIVLGVGVIVAAPILCVTIFGDEFRGSVDDLRVLVFGAVGIVALKQLGSALTARQKPTLASAAISVAFVLTIVLDLLLIPPYGGLGAALASTLSYLAGGVAVGIIFTRALGGSAGDLVPRGSEMVWYWRTLSARVRRPPGAERREASEVESSGGGG